MKKLAVANGSYTNSNGEQKTKWVSVGVIGMSQNGKEYMLIDPTINFAGFPREDGKDMVMVGIFDDQQQQVQQTQQVQQPTGMQSPIHNVQKPQPIQVDDNSLPF